MDSLRKFNVNQETVEVTVNRSLFLYDKYLIWKMKSLLPLLHTSFTYRLPLLHTAFTYSLNQCEHEYIVDYKKKLKGNLFCAFFQTDNFTYSLNQREHEYIFDDKKKLKGYPV